MVCWWLRSSSQQGSLSADGKRYLNTAVKSMSKILGWNVVGKEEKSNGVPISMVV